MSLERKNRPRKLRKPTVSAVDAFKHLLPEGFKLEAPTAIEVSKERHQVFMDRSATFGEAVTRALAIDRLTDHSSTVAMLHVATSESIAELAKVDPLEDFRKKAGLSSRRDELMNALYRTISFEEGMRMTNLTARRVMAKRFGSMRELNEDLPHVTATEVTLTSLIAKTPDNLLIYGRKQDQVPSDPEVRMLAMPLLIVGASMDGLIFVPETDNINLTSESDPYSAHGITGVSAENDIIPFTSEVKSAIDELIPLSMSNYRLHQRVWDRADSAVLDGTSKLDRLAAINLGLVGQDDSIPTMKIIDSLPFERLREFRAEQLKLSTLLARHVIIDLQAGEPLDGFEKIKLLGLLNSIPSSLLDPDKPFQGMLLAYGPGVMLTDMSGRTVEYQPYHPYYLRTAMQGLYTESVDSTKNNRTIALIFNDLSSQAEGLVMHQAELSGEDPSLLESVKIDLKLLYGIDLQTRPEMEFVETDVSSAKSQMGDRLTVVSTEKFNLGEARQIYEVLKLIPRPFHKGITSFEKKTNPEFDFEHFKSGLSLGAHFNRSDGSITLHQQKDIPYSSFTDEMKSVRDLAIAHEVAHAMWINLSEAVRSNWTSISWKDKTEDKIPPEQQFLTMYSRTQDEEEDFCEHFASYIFHAEEFRQKSKEYPRILEKYRQIRQLFLEVTGNVMEYRQISRFSLEQLTGAIDAEAKKHTEGETVLAEEIFIREKRAAPRGRERKIVTRLDEGFDDILTSEDVPEIDPYESSKERGELDFLLSFKSNSLRDLEDYFSTQLNEAGAIAEAKKIFQLIEDGESAKAEASMMVLDNEELKEVLLIIREASEVYASDNPGAHLLEKDIDERLSNLSDRIIQEIDGTFTSDDQDSHF